MGTYLLLNLIFCGAFCLHGTTGFGAGLLAVPLMLLLFEPRTAVPLMILLACLVQLGLFWEARRQIDYKKVGFLFGGAVLGIPLGISSLLNFPAVTIERALSIIIILFCILFIKKMSKTIKQEFLTSTAVGFLSGAITGFSAMGGPLVVIWGINQKWPEQELRANLIAYFELIAALIVLPIYTGYGLIDLPLLKLAFAALPGLVGGFLLGIWLKTKVLAHQQLLTKIAITILVCTAISTFFRTVV